ncbi:MAG TPA: chemotaxis protein CheW, partial [Nitrospirales bacterium]|nr:chemotaxis protein CheW [Nitrospirales bacterium]
MGAWDGIPTAETDHEAGEAGEMLQVVSFKLGAEEFAVDILLVQEINRIVDITPVPKAPTFVEGVINLRGKIVPILDLRKRFGFPDADTTDQSRIIVVDVQDRVLGLVVDSVSEVLQIPAHILEPPPSLVAGVSASYIKGVGKIEDRLLIL